jgi:hypothetical protein
MVATGPVVTELVVTELVAPAKLGQRVRMAVSAIGIIAVVVYVMMSGGYEEEEEP